MTFTKFEITMTTTNGYKKLDDSKLVFPSDTMGITEIEKQSGLLSVNQVHSLLRDVYRKYYDKYKKHQTKVNPKIFKMIMVSFFKPKNPIDFMLLGRYMIINVKPFMSDPHANVRDNDVGHFILLANAGDTVYVFPLYNIRVPKLEQWLTGKDDKEYPVGFSKVVYDYSVQQHHRSESCGWYCIKTILEIEEGTRHVPNVTSSFTSEQKITTV